MTTLNLEGSSSFIVKVVSNGLVVVVEEDMDGHWTGAANNVAAGEHKVRNEEKREKYYHLCMHTHDLTGNSCTKLMQYMYTAASLTPTQCRRHLCHAHLLRIN